MCITESQINDKIYTMVTMEIERPKIWKVCVKNPLLVRSFKNKDHLRFG